MMVNVLHMAWRYATKGGARRVRQQKGKTMARSKQYETARA